MVVSVPAMTSRADLRRISARLLDLRGVVALEGDLEARSIRITGAVAIDEIRAAIAASGYEPAS